MKALEYDLGNLGESIAGAILSLIFDGEVQRETMRGEGMGSLDLQLKFPIHYPVKSYKQIGVQVKTGNSFARWKQSSSHFVLQGINTNHILKWISANQPVLLVWVKPGRQTCFYWRLFGTKNSLGILNLYEGHKLNPAAKFEIEREITLVHSHLQLIPKISLKSLTDVSEIIKWSKGKYKDLLGTFDTKFGKIDISLFAWRHLTRKGKPVAEVKDCLLLLPHVCLFLKKTPHEIQTISAPEMVKEIGQAIQVKRKVLFTYKNIAFNDRNVATVYIRFEEIIVYPKDWLTNHLLNQSIMYSMKLESIYRK